MDDLAASDCALALEIADLADSARHPSSIRANWLAEVPDDPVQREERRVIRKGLFLKYAGVHGQ